MTFDRVVRPRRFHCAAVLAFGSVLVAAAQEPAPLPGQGNAGRPVVLQLGRPPMYFTPIRLETSTLYFDGSQIEIEVNQHWKFMCGSNWTGRTNADLRQIAELHDAEMSAGAAVIVDTPGRGSGINIIYNLGPSVPSAAVSAFGLAETYIESQLGDPINVSINASFQNLGGGVIGTTGSQFISNVTYTASRNGLINGMDDDDVIQDWMPTGGSMPIRFDGGSATVSNESSINWTVANYRAAIGTTGGSAGNMTFNTDFSFDYNPANGVNGTSFVDVLVHETTHALGFVSAVDTPGGTDTDSLDMFRFQRTDGGGGNNFNPDTLAQFQTTARLNDFDNPDDNHNFDVISDEFRMSDGDPWQASHWRLQPSVIGVMEPAFGEGETFFPNYYSEADLIALDAIGYDYPPCTGPAITQQPQSQDACAGDTVVLTATASGSGNTFQWRRGGVDITNGGRISGATTATLTITDVNETDAGDDYNLAVTDSSGCTSVSNDAAITLGVTANFTQQPQDRDLDVGAVVVLNVFVDDPETFAYQWTKDNVDLSDGGRIIGATARQLTINSAIASDSGVYRCRVSSLVGECSITSNPGTVSVSCLTPAITQQPAASQTVCSGTQVSLTVGTDVAFPSFQWRRGTTPLVDGPNITGANTDTLTILNVGPGDAGNDYNALVTNEDNACQRASNNATINVSTAVEISQQPQDANPDAGQTAMFSVTVNDPGSRSYQWRRNTTPLSDGGRISGATTATLTINAVEAGDAGEYDVVITPSGGVCPAVTSDSATLTVGGGGDPCPGDVDGDNDVDLSDLATLLANFGSTGVTRAEGDLDGDTDVDLADLATLLGNFGNTCP